MRRADRQRLAAAWLLSVLPVACLPGRAEETRAITLTAVAVALNPSRPEQTRVGQLRFLAGFHLVADDGGFGGFSGLVIDPEGRWLTAVSDRGRWWSAELSHDPAGTLKGFANERLGPLLDVDGKPVSGRERNDAEEIVALPEGGFVVSFEGTHRLARYPFVGSGIPVPDGIPEPWPFPAGIGAAPSNSGMEAVARLADGRWLVLSEDLETEAGDYLGWLGEPASADWQSLALAASLKLHPTGAAVLPGGAVAVLERSYDPERGPHVRLVVIEPSEIVPGGRLVGRSQGYFQPPFTVENFEALAARTGPQGQVLLYLLSDDNFDSRQRTLLLQFALERPPIPPNEP